MMRFIYLICGGISLALGTLGIFLPLLPTVPLVLLAAFFFARSSPKIHDWLLAHPIFGPQILDWRQSGAIRPKAKKMASVTIALAFGLSLLLGVSAKILIIQAVVLSCVLVFIWTRPSS